MTHYSAKVRKNFTTIVDAYKQLRRLGLPWEGPQAQDTPAIAEHLIAEHERHVRDMFRILDLNGPSAIESLRREARRIPPASTSLDAKGSGARDVAIWLSAVQFSAQNAVDVFLVSKDRAFKSATLQEDLGKSDSKVDVIDDLPELLAKLANKVPIDFDIRGICNSQTVHEAVISSFESYRTHEKIHPVIEFPTRVGGDITKWAVPELKLIDVTDVHGYAVRSSTWVTAKSLWFVTYIVETIVLTTDGDEVSAATWQVTFRVTTTLLLNLGEGTIGVDVISVSDPAGLSGQVITSNS